MLYLYVYFNVYYNVYYYVCYSVYVTCDQTAPTCCWLPFSHLINIAFVVIIIPIVNINIIIIGTSLL